MDDEIPGRDLSYEKLKEKRVKGSVGTDLRMRVELAAAG